MKKIKILGSILISCILLANCQNGNSSDDALAMMGLLLLSQGSSGSASTVDQWTVQNSGTGQTLNSVAYLNGKFFATGANGTLLSSTDGSSWSAVTLTTTNTLNRIALVGSTYVLLGAGGYVATSANGTTWTEGTVAGQTANNFYDLAYDGSSVTGIVGGSSSDTSGVVCATTTVTNLGSYNCATGGTGALYRVVRYGTRFDAVGGSGRNTECTATCQTATNWINYSITGNTTSNFTGIASNGSHYFMVASGRVLGTSNFINFQVYISSLLNLRDITHDGTQYLAVGNSGLVYTNSSTSSISWTKRNSGVSSTLNGVAFGGGKYVAVGNSGAIITHAKY